MANSSPGITRLTISETLASSSSRSSVWEVTVDTSSRKSSSSDRSRKRTALRVVRSEEHTSELQSPCNLVCRLLLEKKKTTHYNFAPQSTSHATCDTRTAARAP